jgi:D-xylose transport system permease protein
MPSQQANSRLSLAWKVVVEANMATQAESPVIIGTVRSQSVTEYVRTYLRRISSGDLGALPIIIGLIIIAAIFQTQNSNYLTSRNFVNLITQMAGITMMAYGVVFVLLLGEIDLSIGYVSAIGGVTVAMLLRDPDAVWQWYNIFPDPIRDALNLQSIGAISWDWYTAIPVALLATAGIGLLQGLIITVFRVPSFIVTLSGLLAWNGVVLRLVGDGGTVIIQDKLVVKIANYYLNPESMWGWGFLIGGVALFAAIQLAQYLNRRRHGLTTAPIFIILLQVTTLAVIGGAVVYIANKDRGVPIVGVILVIFLVFLTFIARNTQFGRFVYAVGGNQEAARRAGISVMRIRIMVFIISSTLAGVGGIILASRLRSVDTGAGGGNLLLNAIAAAVVGGTSLFGGRGHLSSAMLGALIIASVENGMSLLNLASGDKFIITGIVLLAAVIIDSLSRRRQQQAGIA